MASRRHSKKKRPKGRALNIATAVWLTRRIWRVARGEVRRTWRTSSRRPRLARR